METVIKKISENKSLILLVQSCYDLAIKNLLQGNVQRYIWYKKQYTHTKSKLYERIGELAELY